MRLAPQAGSEAQAASAADGSAALRRFELSGRARALAEALRLRLGVFKPRIGAAIALASVAGAAATPGAALAGWQFAVLALAVAMTSAAAGAFNQLTERGLDARMRRTRGRAFVTGRLRAGAAWWAASAALAASGIALAALALNARAALFIFLGAFTYAIVYTRWLKPRTPWNIVIGGLAGSFAVLAGGAAAAAHSIAPAALALALVLFLWTPPHFWSLAIAYREDYAAAAVPMLPVVVGDARAARAVLAGAALLVAASLLPAALGLGALYLAAAAGAGAWLLGRSVQLVREPGARTALANFHASLIYLAVVLGAAIADPLLRA